MVSGICFDVELVEVVGWQMASLFRSGLQSGHLFELLDGPNNISVRVICVTRYSTTLRYVVQVDPFRGSRFGIIPHVMRGSHFTGWLGHDGASFETVICRLRVVRP